MSKKRNQSLTRLLERLSIFTSQMANIFEISLEDFYEPDLKFVNPVGFEKQVNKIKKSQKLDESLFISLFSQFERFLSSLIDDSLEISKYKEAFKKEFNDLCEIEMEKFSKRKNSKDYRKWADLHNKSITTLKKNKNLLIAEKNPLDLAIKILLNLGQSADKPKGLKEQYILYGEIKERRNNLIHSGINPTPNYKDALNTLFRKQQKAERIIHEKIYTKLVKIYSITNDENSKKRPKRIEQDPDKIKDLSINQSYLFLVFETLIQIASFLVMSVTKELRQNRYYFIHDLLALSEKYPEATKLTFLKTFLHAVEISEIEPETTMDIFNNLLVTNIDLKKLKKYLRKRKKYTQIFKILNRLKKK